MNAWIHLAEYVSQPIFIALGVMSMALSVLVVAGVRRAVAERRGSPLFPP